MRVGAKLILMLFMMTILVSQYQNCSNYSNNSMFENSLANNTQSDLAAQSTGATNVNFSVKNVQSDLYVYPYDGSIQLGGSCNPGGHTQNYFEYSLSLDTLGPVIVNVPGSTQTEKMRLADARCEGGRFYLVIPILCPGDGWPTINTPIVTGTLKIIFHTFDGFDATGKQINYLRKDTSVFIDIAKPQGCG